MGEKVPRRIITEYADTRITHDNECIRIKAPEINLESDTQNQKFSQEDDLSTHGGNNMEKIFVWIKRPKEPARHVWISNTLENLQKNVGGYIEALTIAKNMVVICNEEGRLRGLPFNCEICGERFVGTIIIAGVNGDEFADCPVDKNVMKEVFPQLFERN